MVLVGECLKGRVEPCTRTYLVEVIKRKTYLLRSVARHSLRGYQEVRGIEYLDLGSLA